MTSSDDPRIRLQVNNLAQQFAYIHGCSTVGKPVCDRCRLEARATWSRLSGDRIPEPA